MTDDNRRDAIKSLASRPFMEKAKMPHDEEDLSDTIWDAFSDKTLMAIIEAIVSSSNNDDLDSMEPEAIQKCIDFSQHTVDAIKSTLAARKGETP